MFSYNAVVGERTADKGYLPATVYTSGGKSEAELGGGVCQVSSTIYLCALLADLDIVERTEHMFAVTYVPYGLDATVYWGSLDFKFKNSTNYPMRIDASVSDGYVHIKLVGTKETDTTIKLNYQILSSTAWEDKEEIDETKPADYKEVTQTPIPGIQCSPIRPTTTRTVRSWRRKRSPTANIPNATGSPPWASQKKSRKSQLNRRPRPPSRRSPQSPLSRRRIRPRRPLIPMGLLLNRMSPIPRIPTMAPRTRRRQPDRSHPAGGDGSQRDAIELNRKSERNIPFALFVQSCAWVRLRLRAQGEKLRQRLGALFALTLH